MRAVIQIREMLPSKKQGTVKFKTYANQTFNCNKEELNPHFAQDERYMIDYNVSEFQGSNGPVQMKWVNQARFWKEEDGPNNPPDKEVYKGGGSGGYSGGNSGGSMKKDNYDPEVGKRQTACNCAMSYLANAGVTITELETNLPVVADMVLAYLNGGAPKSDAGVPDKGSEASADGDPGAESEEFGF
jgi:hypothetical protein